MKSLRAFARQLFEASCGIIKAQKLDDPHEDVPLTLMYVPKGTRSANLVVPMADGPIIAQEAVAMSLMAAYESWGPPSIIIHAVDAHMKVLSPGDDDIENYERGDIANDPSSTELLIALAYCQDAYGLSVIGRYMPYGYDDDGSIRFDEVINLEEPPGGAIDDIIRQVFAKEQR